LLIAEGGVDGDRKLAVGAWRYTDKQDDVRDLTLAGDPVQRTAQGAYVVYEQPLTGGDGPRATTAFIRAGVSDGDTTPFAGGWQAGVLVERPFASHPDSAFSFGVNQGVLSDGYRQNQIDLGADIADSEMQVETTYSDRVLPFLSIQPDLQWVRRPGGDRGVEDAFVAALRISIDI
jgi:porin